ncbi:MAE_28990/MAE_18760 family HEPN-like nuclease [Vibrio sp. CyArs1]|uniref:MAE_28990/MAE_18760 family HEPN-like nuclease n=1 Tax=Vibrio sp. CyArs1 TaxID=2682577 RepID=UPI001F069928|nr:MAE_28990/MAE_18760 family HEPN-like nuclease [Vibrio sp. CyArs1]
MNEYIEDAIDLLEERSQEIERHLCFVKELIDSKPQYLAKVSDEKLVKSSDYQIDRRLVKTLSAASYLLIYNLVESVMTDCLDAVHKQLKSEKLSFFELSKELQKICLKDFNKFTANHKTAENHGEITLEKAMTWLGYNRFNHFNGNIDAKMIQKKAGEYGFSIGEHDRKFTEDGKILKDIRDNRNRLAHGEVSFETCGQETAIEALITLHQQTKVYLNAVLIGVDQYLTAQQYKRSSLTS